MIYRLGPFCYYGYSRISRTADQRRTRIGAETLRRNGDLDNHGIHVYDHHLTAEKMTMTPNGGDTWHYVLKTAYSESDRYDM